MPTFVCSGQKGEDDAADGDGSEDEPIKITPTSDDGSGVALVASMKDHAKYVVVCR